MTWTQDQALLFLREPSPAFVPPPAHAKPFPAPSHSNQLPDLTSSAHLRSSPFSAARCCGAKPFLCLHPQTPPRMPTLVRISSFTAQATKSAAFPDASCLWGMRSCYSAVVSLSTCCLIPGLICKLNGARMVFHRRLSPTALGMGSETEGEHSAKFLAESFPRTPE